MLQHSGSSPPLFEFREAPGPYSVGFQIVEQYDYSRVFREPIDALGAPYSGERARPLQTLIWYPAQANDAASMTVGDYWSLWTTETSFGRPVFSVRAREWRSAIQASLTKPLRAVAKAAPIEKRFPVVIYAPSFSSVAWENADLCEYLASHGYLVMASPNMGAMTRNMTVDLAGIHAQARDISFLVGYAASLPNTDMAGIGVVGFSWGGISNLFAAAADDRIRALVAFDGSLRYRPGLVHQGGVHPERMTIPLLYFAQGGLSLEEQAYFLSGCPSHAQGPNVLNAWTAGDLISVRMLGMTHGAFSSMFQRNEDVWQDFFDKELPGGQVADYGREDLMLGYAWTARYTRAFLDAYLKQDAAADDFLRRDPIDNGVPARVMAVQVRPAEEFNTGLRAFRACVAREGFERIGDICAAMRKECAHFELHEASLVAWAEELIDAWRLEQALAVLKLNVELHSTSSGAYSLLGRLYEMLAEPERALEHYQLALKRDRRNPTARRRSRVLELQSMERRARRA
jgi:hypothetical protein